MLDRNGDGVLQQPEIDMAVVSLRQLDRNGDGNVTRDEMVAPPRRRGERAAGDPRPDQPRPDRPGSDAPARKRNSALPNLAEMDKDGDGKLSPEELPERMRARFEQMDRNGDGTLDQEEREAVMEMIRQRWQNARGQNPGSNPGRRPEPGAGEGGSDRPKRPGSDDSE